MSQPIKISLFYCSNSIDNLEISQCSAKISKDIDFHPVSLPCSGKLNLLYLLKSVENGSDGVILITCKIGECKFLQGNLRAKKRVEAVNHLLDETGIGNQRIRFIELKDMKTEMILHEINQFAEVLKNDVQLVNVKI